ncbi:MAG: metallophosphoesterase family protein [Deltaproteobacteria bacterium]|nr:metallophosphoesterase family protein [Deltaproteobacteria bacterium]
MVTIGVISDTHLYRPSKELSRLVTDGPFSGVDMVFHSGDIVKLSVLDALAPKEVVAVAGNMDDHDVAVNLPDKRIVEVEGFLIGITHGRGPREGLEARVAAIFTGVSAICYGHSHTPANHVKNGVLLFNPGSFSSGTVGILTVDKKISGEIIQL